MATPQTKAAAARSSSNVCARCFRPNPRKRKRALCTFCDEERRREELGVCIDCGERAVWAKQRCAGCDQRHRRSQQLSSYFSGNPLNQDDFVHLVERIIERLVDALRRSHVAYERYIETGEGWSNPDVIQIQTILFTARDLRDNQYSYVLRAVNRQLEGVYHLRVSYKREEHG